MRRTGRDSRPPAALRGAGPFVLFAAVLLAGVFLGQRGIPVEDGGEMLAVASLGGTCHPPGMPLLALLLRASWAALGRSGPSTLMALASAATVSLLFRGRGFAGAVTGLAFMLLPAVRERLLCLDAYPVASALFAAALTLGRDGGIRSGLLAGLGASVHPAGVLIAAVAPPARRRAALYAGGLLLGLSAYLALPVWSSAGCVVDWGTPNGLKAFVRQITAAGYRDYYGASMGRFDVASLERHLEMLGGMLWPGALLPVLAGALILAKRAPVRLATPLILVLSDMLFTVFVNPMASGTSQTGWLSLIAFLVLASEASVLLPRPAALAAAAAVAAGSLAGGEPLPDQSGAVEGFLAGMPADACVFIESSDLLYGCWAVQHAGRDARPDVACLSTENFSAWFERMARHHSPDLDTSSGVLEAGGYDMPREALAARLMELTAERNPGRPVLIARRARLHNASW